jgi:carboxypeptidase Q
VPGFLLLLADEWFTRKYFAYHHTDADTIDKVNPQHMIQNVQVLASFAYLLADVPFTLPRAKATIDMHELPFDKLQAKMIKEQHLHGPH